jgi:hypothetical protein
MRIFRQVPKWRTVTLLRHQHNRQVQPLQAFQIRTATTKIVTDEAAEIIKTREVAAVAAEVSEAKVEEAVRVMRRTLQGELAGARKVVENGGMFIESSFECMTN